MQTNHLPDWAKEIAEYAEERHRCSPLVCGEYIPALLQALSEARGALEFYVDPWDRKDEDGDPVSVPDFYSEMDFGSRATKALSFKPEEVKS